MNFETFSNNLYEIFSKKTYLNALNLDTILKSIPRVDELIDVSPGDSIIIRADLDIPINNGVVSDLSRLYSLLETIEFCLSKDWKIILIGHIGRDKEDSLAPVSNALGDLLKQKINFIEDWINESSLEILPEALNKVCATDAKSVIMLENIRKYNIERALWYADDNAFKKISIDMFNLSKHIRDKFGDIEINEAIAASNLDFSSCSLPLLMSKTCFGFFIDNEIKTHIANVRNANMVIFSGLKINKLDDLQGIIERGGLKKIIAAGSLAMALKKAQYQLQDSDFSVGLAELDESKKFYIDKKRIEQAKEIVRKCHKESIDLILPIDFILDNGETSKTIPDDRSQMDIGPETISLIDKVISAYINESHSSSDNYVMFYNGVFGKFEDSKFENGTKNFIGLLKKMTADGILTYVGGGEGRLALLKYGALNQVTHAFTCGGTVLKSLSNNHIGYLKSMYLQNTLIKENR